MLWLAPRLNVLASSLCALQRAPITPVPLACNVFLLSSTHPIGDESCGAVLGTDSRQFTVPAHAPSSPCRPIASVAGCASPRKLSPTPSNVVRRRERLALVDRPATLKRNDCTAGLVICRVDGHPVLVIPTDVVSESRRALHPTRIVQARRSNDSGETPASPVPLSGT